MPSHIHSAVPGHDSEPAGHDAGLADHLSMFSRRRALSLLAGAAGLAALAACGDSKASSSPSVESTELTTTPATVADTTASTTASTDGVPSSTSTPTPTTVGGAAESCAVIPQETGGPFPGDGSNGPNVLSQSGVVRRDIRTSIGDASGTAEGVELTLNLTIVDAANGCAPLAGAAVYIWHCTREGEYSMYGQSVAGENFLRGVQQAGADGTMTFTTVFPGCYSGRWPHIHFEVYPTAQAATSASGALTTSQLALPQAACNQAYAATGYELSVSNFSGASLTQDMVFSDGVDQQLAVVDGSLEAGFVASLTITV